MEERIAVFAAFHMFLQDYEKRAANACKVKKLWHLAQGGFLSSGYLS